MFARQRDDERLTDHDFAGGPEAAVSGSLSAAKGAEPGDHTAILSVANGGTPVAHSVAYTFVT